MVIACMYKQRKILMVVAVIILLVNVVVFMYVSTCNRALLAHPSYMLFTLSFGAIAMGITLTVISGGSSC